MTLVLGGWLITSALDDPRPDAGVRIVGDRVKVVGANEELRIDFPDDPVVDATGHVIMPGLVNTHLHMYGVLAHGFPLDAAPTGFWSFLHDFWWPKVEDALDHDMIRAATEWACIELLRTGTTTFLDILEAPNAVHEGLFVQKEVVARWGLRGVLSFEATERSGPEIARAGLGENAALVTSCGPGDLVQGMVSFHTTFTCSTDFILRSFALAGELGVLCHAHANEGIHEPQWCLENKGIRTFEFYEQLGVASDRFLASQCVQLSERERRIMSATGIRAAHNPLSNGEVGGGIAPIPELLDAGVTIGLGTDGYINDMFEVMRAASLIHKARLLDPGTMPARRVLHMATEMGALALGRTDTGRLEPGRKADLLVVDGTFPTPVAAHNLAEQLVLYRSGRDVRDVMIDGHWRVRSGEVMGADRDAIRARVHHEAERLWTA